jgi:hypothetical protein
MDVTGFLCVSLGSSTVQLHYRLGSTLACACSEARFSSQNGDSARGVYYGGAVFYGALFAAKITQCPCHFTHGERAPRTHWLGGWVDPRAGLDDVKKRKFLILLRLKLRPLGRPARSQSLYRLRYPGSTTQCKEYAKRNISCLR